MKLKCTYLKTGKPVNTCDVSTSKRNDSKCSKLKEERHGTRVRSIITTQRYFQHVAVEKEGGMKIKRKDRMKKKNKKRSGRNRKQEGIVSGESIQELR